MSFLTPSPEVRQRQLLCGNAQLVAQLAHGGVLDARHRCRGNVLRGVHLRRRLPVQRVAAAGVCPHPGKCHLCDREKKFYRLSNCQCLRRGVHPCVLHSSNTGVFCGWYTTHPSEQPHGGNQRLIKSYMVMAVSLAVFRKTPTFPGARCCNSSRSEASNRNTEKARCSRPPGWAASNRCASRLLALPVMMSAPSTRMHWSRSSRSSWLPVPAVFDAGHFACTPGLMQLGPSKQAVNQTGCGAPVHWDATSALQLRLLVLGGKECPPSHGWWPLLAARVLAARRAPPAPPSARAACRNASLPDVAWMTVVCERGRNPTPAS